MAARHKAMDMLVLAALLAATLTSSTQHVVSANEVEGGGGRLSRLNGPIDPIIRNRHGAALPFNPALFPQIYNRKPWITETTTRFTKTSPPGDGPKTVTATSTKTIILRGATITSYQTKTDTKTLYSTKTVIQGFPQPEDLAKIIQFDRAATANPDCGLDASTTTLTKSEFVNVCRPSTTTLTRNPSNSATETITHDPITETYRTVLITTKPTFALAQSGTTVTNHVTIVKPVTFTRGLGCDVATVYQTVTKSLAKNFGGVCPHLETTVTVRAEEVESTTVTIFDKQTLVETQTVDDFKACNNAVTETASAAKVTILNYDYLTETIIERATYERSCSDSLFTVTATVNPTKTVKDMQISFVTVFQTTHDADVNCPDTVTVTPTVIATDVVHEYASLTRTIVQSSFAFVGEGTEVFAVVPTVAVTDTETVVVTATEIMADHFCAVVPLDL